ncbi:hypothetical protein J421_4958 (plasmid) [Gemmatirosa kalamazoonensis]|uniref:NHL repeat containing protein n=1 Tax=Gemmatirosa kalamazoonensis TaxID=861299 RepID=W0RSC3_9BACT|nr:hypothetical protein [Gemmatirosa kalamazoonensis]AHG92493.1 hypothetical protein J421_4958 [Gemmatirosa kalamazoonensis]
MTRHFFHAAPVAVLAFGTVAGAQQVPNARPLGATIATVAEPFGGVQSLRQLPDGRLLVNDPSKRRVILFEADLSKYTVVADSTSATANAYSGRMAGLIPYRADSTLFVDPTSMSMLVIDPKGNLGTRVMSVPRPDDAFALTGLAFGLPGFDKQGRLVYRAQPRFEFRGGPGPGQPGFKPPQMPDSAPIVRVELATRKVDTVTFVKTYAPKMTMTQGENGRISMSSVLNPLPTVDDWAITPDGTVIVLRGREFRVDYTDASGTLVQGPKVAHDWQRMSDEEKVAFLDSTKTAMEKARAEMQTRIQQNGGNVERAMAAGAAAAGAGGGAPMPMIRIEMAGGGGEPPRRGEQRSGPNGAAPNANITMPPLTFVEPSELPDYKPAFAAGATRADADGNVWVRLIATKPMPGPVYDIIDESGKLLDRVVLPPNSAIAGFGPGVVYLATRDAEGTHLKKVAVK